MKLFLSLLYKCVMNSFAKNCRSMTKHENCIGKKWQRIYNSIMVFYLKHAPLFNVNTPFYVS